MYVLVHVSGAQNNKRQLQIVEKKRVHTDDHHLLFAKKPIKKSEEKDLELSSTPHILVMMFFFFSSLHNIIFLLNMLLNEWKLVDSTENPKNYFSFTLFCAKLYIFYYNILVAGPITKHHIIKIRLLKY